MDNNLTQQRIENFIKLIDVVKDSISEDKLEKLVDIVTKINTTIMVGGVTCRK
jgi:hypothetical protein